MQHPTEDDVLVFRAADEVTQQVSDVVHHHCFRLIGNDERLRTPTPIAVKEDVVWQQLL